MKCAFQKYKYKLLNWAFNTIASFKIQYYTHFGLTKDNAMICVMLIVERILGHSSSYLKCCYIEYDDDQKKVIITFYTSRPGVLIGKGGSVYNYLIETYQNIFDKKVEINIKEVK